MLLKETFRARDHDSISCGSKSLGNMMTVAVNMPMPVARDTEGERNNDEQM
jgi:hypothetical protein